ncbi:glycoside hydrolase family 9 protein [Natronospora cellulosivora (SeqCode)]
MKKYKIFTLIILLFLIASSISLAADYNYVDALAKSILFYDANMCGPEAADNRFQWRDACHIHDGQDVGLDLTGGFHDAGDHMKFGLPQAYSSSVLAYTMYLYEDTLKDKGQYDYLYRIVKHFTDYYIRSHPDPNTFYYQVSDGNIDHAYWGPPELQKGERPTYAAITPSTPASGVAGQTAASLALMYLNSKDSDPEYAAIALENAKSIYNLGKNHLGTGGGQSFYVHGPYWDELAWAGIWLYNATGDNQYLEDVDFFIRSHLPHGAAGYVNRWTLCWDDVWAVVFMEMYRITGESVYRDAIEANLNYWMNEIQTTPGGLSYLTEWGVNRYAAAQAFLALIYYDMTNNGAYRDYAKSQIDYMLGSNPRNSSYVVGFGENYPQFPHHRGSSGRLEGPPADEKKEMPQRHILYGALVGGPQADDSYIDDIDDYRFTEVAIDYNAGFVGAMAGIAKHFGQGQLPEPIPQEPEVEEIYVEASIGTQSGTEIGLSFYLVNESIHPPRYEDKLSFRYFMDLTSIYNSGYSANDVSTRIDYDENGASVSPVREWDRDNHIYYVEIDYHGVDLYGPSELQLFITSYSTSALNAQDDPSREGLSSSLSKSEFIPVYRDGEKIYGLEPGEDNGHEELKYGDLNGDNRIDSLDYMLLARYVLSEISEFPVGNTDLADLNQDGVIDSRDLMILGRYLMTMIDELPYQQ